VKNFKVIFKRSLLYTLVNALLIFVMLLIASACDNSTSISPSETTSPSVTLPPGTELPFDSVLYSGNLGGPYEGKSAQIRVIQDIQTLTPEWFDWVDPQEQNAILSIDYSKYFVVIAFNGYRTSIYSDLSIQRIWQSENEVFVLAHFNDFISGATSLPAFNSQYQVVKIDKTLITHLGEITFRLLDELGEERARAVYDISQ
jgi:hypothetical protein